MTRRFPFLAQPPDAPAADVVPLVEFLRRRLALALLAEDSPTCIRLMVLLDQELNGAG